MQNVKNAVSAKVLSLILVISMLLGLFPQTVVYATEEAVEQGTIATLVDGGTVDGNTVIFSVGTELNWSTKDPSVGRWTDGWWVGIKVTAPENINLDTASYQNKTSDGWGEAKSFKQYRDSNDNSATQYITLWGIVNEEYLNDAIINGKEYVEYGYQFDWNGDGIYEQPISMRVDPYNIILNKQGVQEYPKTTGLANVDVITNGISVNENGSNIVTIETTAGTVLDWVEANAGIGRTEDGWWIGYTLTAPDGFSSDASYQHKTSSGWGNECSFAEYRDTENSIGVWRLVNEVYLRDAAANNGNVNYTTRYDWDGDGIYEQIVILKIVPSKVTLIAQNGEQVYPYLGTVTPLTGGSVSGNTSNLELKIEETTLNWSAKDETIGRYTDGWWVGMKVTAPEGCSVDQLKEATYKKRVTNAGGKEWSAYSSETSFWSAKDSEDSDLSHYIGMWMAITPSLLSTYQNSGTSIKTEYVFDWDNDGTDDQIITLIVVPSDKIILNKVEQTGFAFIEPNPIDKWVGETYTNIASGGQGTGAVTYAITSGSDVADIDEVTGELTFKKTGIVKVSATKAADETYAQVSAAYTVKAIKYPQAVFGFENSNANITVDFAAGSFTNTASGGSGDGNIKYSIISGSSIATIDENSGKVTFLKAGDITVVATKEADNNYTEITATYTLKIEKSDQDALHFENAEPEFITYNPNAQDILPALKGGNGSGKVTYSILEGDEYATIDPETGAVTTLKAGGEFIVKVEKSGDDGYNETSYISAGIYVEYADQANFAFAETIPDNVTFNDNNNKFSNVASGGESIGAITYTFADAESEEIADINEKTGEITINAAGTINVVATKAGDDCYNEVMAKYSLTIEKDIPEFFISDVDLIYGVLEYQINVNTTVGGFDNYVYSIEGVNNIGASVDSNGKVTFENSSDKVGSITVLVKREADNQYVAVEKSFTLTVSYHETETQPTVTGETKNESGWYTDSVVIHAPDGYTIAYDNKLDTTWKSEVTYTEEGVNEVFVYLKSADGYITDQIAIDDIKLDTGNPDANTIAITYATPTWEKVLETITFGIYKSETLLVKLAAKDTNSGIASLTYNLGGEDVVITFDGEMTVSHSFTINAQHRNEITLIAADVAGRQTQINSEHILVLDTKIPEINTAYEFASGQHREEDDIFYTQDDVRIILTINETNFDLSDSPVVTVNGKEMAVDWSKIVKTDNWQTTLLLSGDGDYVVKVNFTDIASNEMSAFTQEVHIDNEAPVFTVTYDNNEARNENNYKADRTATVRVTEHNFKAEEVVLTVSAKDITGADVDISSKAYADYAKNEANWKYKNAEGEYVSDAAEAENADDHYLVLPVFDIDAIYSVKIEYTDLAGNEAVPYTADFVIDKTIAGSGDITIEYTDSIVDKILETVTFGFYQGDVKFKVTVKDQTAGIEYFEITYTQIDGNNNSNKATYTTEKLTAVQDATDKTVFTATHTITAEARGTVSVNLLDRAGNNAARSEEYVVVADTIAPGLEYQWKFTDDQVREYNDIFYTREESRVKFTITEANFDLSLMQAAGSEGEEETAAPAPSLTVNSVAQDITWTQIAGTDKWEGEITLTGNGDYVVELSYTDRSTNAMETYTQEVHIDNEAPVFTVTYDNNEARNENNYKADRTATVRVTEHNFKAEEVVLTVTAKDITGADVDIFSKAYADYAKNEANWKYKNAEGEYVSDAAEAENADDHYLVLPVFDIDAIYSVKVEYTDLAGNEAVPYTADFVIDHVAPSNIEITYSSEVKFWEKALSAITFGYYSYKDEISVTLTADDITSGIDYFEWTYTQEDGTSSINKVSMTEATQIVPGSDKYSNSGKTAFVTFVIPAQARGYISAEVTDKAGNTSGVKDDTRINVVDNIDPTRAIEFSEARVLDKATMTDVDSYVEGDNVILYYETQAEVTITVNEANFCADDVVVTVTKNGNDSTPDVLWNDENTDTHIGRFTISGDGDYFVKVDYTDRSGNVMETYTSQEIRIDNTDPITSVEYASEAEAVNVKYYKAERKAVITIVDHNFIADDVVAAITAVDVRGNKIANADTICADFATHLKTRSSWTHNGDVHTSEITFTEDAQYTFEINYKDIIGNTAMTYVADPFVVDYAAPVNLNIEYSESIVGKIIGVITFGFYEPKVIVTLTADDITSGVDFFEWTYTKETGVSVVNKEDYGNTINADSITYSEDGLAAKATFEIDADARGYISASVTDRAGNSTNRTDENNITVVVDDIDPAITVNYVADDADTSVQFISKDQMTVGTFNEAVNAYYNGNVTAKITINEANFFEGITVVDEKTQLSEVIHNVGIKLTKTDDDGNATIYEYLPVGAVQKYTDAAPEYITWNTTGDIHSFNISYADNADYVLEIEYTDLSENDASISANDGNIATKSYKSKIVTVDKIAPVVTVIYGNGNVVNTTEGRNYFNAEQYATITVKEHNFRADDFVATVAAEDINGYAVNIEDFRATLSNESNWTKNGDTYTANIHFTADANYSFDYEYKDLAQNMAAYYDSDVFTVDMTAPENLTISYNQSIAERILETITFGYYNAKVTVTISAEDSTSGVERFEYAYLKSEGVSTVNAELLNAAIEKANFTVSGKTSTAVFEIPYDVLHSGNQFNGTVMFVAFDCAGNNTGLDDTRRVIVDNIAPTATITYNEPVQNANNISYYAGNIDAKIVINEANFYSEDVVAKVNDKAVAVKWVDNSVDVHTGTFTLTEDGDYVVSVEYKDRSNNEMTKYTSNRLTLDTKSPTVKATNIKINSANKDEKYGFTITANDINLNAASFKPVLTATVRNDDGSYETKNISLGEMKTVEAGETYTFTVDNLEEDAVYSLSCTLKDMSGNAYSEIALSDGKEYEEVKFSINRNGSTFAVDENTDILVNQYYVYSVDENVVIEEINVDPVESYVVKLNGEMLTEGTDYTSTLSDRPGEWSKRTYIIAKELFEAEGEYSVVVESTDKADTIAYSDVKNLNVSFVVDQTKPVLTISGLQESGRYQVEEQIVTIIPTDDGGRLASLKVIVLDSDGNSLKDATGMDISVRFDMAGEELLAYLNENDGMVIFTVPEGLENQVQIICSDCAVNTDGETNEYDTTFTKVTVSQSRWIIFYANKTLFYGSVAGVFVLVAGIVFLVILKKRKKDKK